MSTFTRTTTGSRPNWVLRIVITIVCAGGFALVSFIAIRMFGAVEGIEFSPDTFASRTFVYYEIPLVRVRITGVYRDDTSGVLQRQLGRGGDLTPAATEDPPRWHLVAMQRGSSYYDDDALIVYRYLHERDSDAFSISDIWAFPKEDAAERWRKWTADHPELAKILWPAVAEAARAELYCFTPELFDTAEQSTVPTGTTPTTSEFKQSIAASMARQYTELADIRRGQGRHKEAIAYYTAALKHDDKFRAAYEGREQSYYNTGESAKSKQDRDRLRELERAD